MTILDEMNKEAKLQDTAMKECLPVPVTKLSTNNSHPANECDYKEKQDEQK